MISSIVIFDNDTQYNITEFVDFNTFTLQDRSDVAFATGSFTAWLSNNIFFTKNIKPYTRLRIDSTDYVCKSECTRYLNESDVYVHNFTITEATCILSCFDVGTKVFSTTGTHKKDYEKVNILLDLTTRKYGWEFQTSGIVSTLNKEIVYTYGAGTKLFDCLNDIASRYNKRVKIRAFLNKTKVRIDFEDINDNTAYNNNNILSYTYSLNDNNYCKYLQSEATNVVDRTTTTTITNLTCRSEDVIYNADSAKLILPSAIDTLQEIKIESMIFGGSLEITGSFLNPSGEPISQFWSGTISQLISNNPIIDTAYNEKYYKYMTRDFYNNLTVRVNSERLFASNEQGGSDALVLPRVINLTPYVLPKEKWDLLTEKQQCSYAYYEQGGNTIENMYGSYKKDLWNELIGEAGKSLLERTFYGVTDASLIGSNVVSISIANNEPDFGHSTNPTLYTYKIKYNAITNPLLIDIKDDVNYSFSQTYNNSSQLIDYDKVAEFMSITNDSMGRDELTIELDTTNSTIPTARKYMMFENVKWYISSVITKYSVDSSTSTLNLVKNYNKEADSIGIDNQYGKTKNPLTMIVDRPIYLGTINHSSMNNMISESTPYFFKFTFGNSSGQSFTYLFKRATLQMSDNTAIFYCEAMDQSIFDVAVSSESYGGTYLLDYATYCDSNNEFYSCYVQLGTLVDMDITNSKLLPREPGVTFNVVKDLGNFIVYKDARERLTFTLKVLTRK